MDNVLLIIVLSYCIGAICGYLVKSLIEKERRNSLETKRIVKHFKN